MGEDGPDWLDARTSGTLPATAPRVAITRAEAQAMAPIKTMLLNQKRAFVEETGMGRIGMGETDRNAETTCNASVDPFAGI